MVLLLLSTQRSGVIPVPLWLQPNTKTCACYGCCRCQPEYSQTAAPKSAVGVPHNASLIAIAALYLVVASFAPSSQWAFLASPAGSSSRTRHESNDELKYNSRHKIEIVTANVPITTGATHASMRCVWPYISKEPAEMASAQPAHR